MLRIILFTLLLTTCSGSALITLEKAEKSGNYRNIVSNANDTIDGDLGTGANTNEGPHPWLKVDFLFPHKVEKVVLEKAWNTNATCVYDISVIMEGEKTLCKRFTHAWGDIIDFTVECGEKRGESVIVDQSGCNAYISIHEMKVYGRFLNSVEALIMLARAEQSGNYHADKDFAAAAIDGDLDTSASSRVQANAWLKVYFLKLEVVQKVVIEQGWNSEAHCVYAISVMEGSTKTRCGTFTRPAGRYNATVECGGFKGDSVIVDQSGCNRYTGIQEINAYGRMSFGM